MEALKEYQKTIERLDLLLEEIIESECVVGEVGVLNSENILTIFGDELVDETELDSIVENFVDPETI
jgi:hypothetical protein